MLALRGRGLESLNWTDIQESEEERNGKQSNGKKEKTCYSCGKHGHLRKDCPDESTAKEERGNSFAVGAAVARSIIALLIDEAGLIVPLCHDCGVDHLRTQVA